MKHIFVTLFIGVLPLVAAGASHGDHGKMEGHGDHAKMEAKREMHVHDAWSRGTPPGAPGAAYFVIGNHTKTADRLLRVSSPIAKRVEMHTTVMEGGMAGMRALQAVDVAADGHVKFEPGGRHVMLMGLDHPLKAGETFPLTLSFEKAGDVTVSVTVRALDAGAPASHHDHSKTHRTTGKMGGEAENAR